MAGLNGLWQVGSFAARLYAARLARRWGQEDLAAACGLALETVAGYESGYRTPGDEHAGALAKALGVSPAWLLRGKLREPGEGRAA